jgi:hypothetical protein
MRRRFRPADAARKAMREHGRQSFVAAANRSSTQDVAAMADDEEEPPHLTETQARAGSTPHVARHVLVWGLILVVLAFALILFIHG